MPQIPNEYTQVVVYIYPRRAAAERGEPESRLGGTGFFIRAPYESPIDNEGQLYIATAAHVVEELSMAYVRINSVTGGVAVWEIPSSGWHLHQDADVAVAPVELERGTVLAGYVPTEAFLSRVDAEKYAIGLGDETFTVGRFVNHEGQQRNTPTVRCGNIAMMPHEPIHAKKRAQLSYLVEARSQSGYSGSPVFVYSPAGTRVAGSTRHILMGGLGPWLLGLVWCYTTTQQVNQQQFLQDHQTGLMGVIPAERIAELLAQEDVVRARAEAQARCLGRLRALGALET